MGCMQDMTICGAVMQAAEYCWEGYHVSASGPAAAARILLQRGRRL